MPPPRRQNPGTPARKPRVAGRAAAATPEQTASEKVVPTKGVPTKGAATKAEPQSSPVEKPSRKPFGRKAKSDTVEPETASAVETAPEETTPTATNPTATKVDLAKSKTEAIEADTGESATVESGAVDTGTVESGTGESTRKKAPAPYKLAKPRVEPAAATADADPAPGPHRRKVDRTTKVLAALAVVFAIVAVVAYLQPGTPETNNTAWVDDEATNEVTAATVTALQTVFSYKADTIDQDQDAARGFLGGDRLDEYNNTAAQTKAGVLQTTTTATATVTDIGVTTLQGDRAELVASMDIAANQDNVDQGTVQTPVVVTMTRVDGRWLITQIDNR